MALFPHQEENVLNGAFFERLPNKLTQLIPRAATYSEVIKVVDAADLDDGLTVQLNANTLKQRVVCYVERRAGTGR